MSQPTAGPPSGGGAPGYDVPEDNAGVEPEKYFAVGKRRRLIGYWVGAIAVIFVGVVLLVAQSEVSSAFDVRQELSQQQFVLVLVRAGFHTALAGAGVYFGYQLLRAAERMILPNWWVSKSPEAFSAFLGIEHPLRESRRELLRIVDLLAKGLGGGKAK